MIRFSSRIAASLLMLSLCAPVPIVHAQSGTLARIVVIQPKPGQSAAFEAGYQRHLEWHRQNEDPWRWYGWTFVLGPRLGLFMDGTFGQTAAGLDRAIKPAEDGADNAKNVTPHADFVSHGVYERLDAISRGDPLPDSSAMLVLDTFEVAPGQERAFEKALVQSATSAGIDRWACYKLRIGGPRSEYLVMRAATSFGHATSLPPIEVPPGIVSRATSELLRYRRELSYEP